MSQKKGPKGPMDRKPIERSECRKEQVPAHIRNLVSLTKRRGLSL